MAIGWRQGKGERAKTFGSLLLAIENDNGDLTYAGLVGTGFSYPDLSELRSQLDKITRKTAPVDDVPARTPPTPPGSRPSCTPRSSTQASPATTATATPPGEP